MRTRKSIRLKGYDYAQPGYYFITVVTQNRSCLFGEIRNQQMHLNDAGRMVEKWYLELANKYKQLVCGTSIVMPNHFHGIIQIKQTYDALPISLFDMICWFKTMTTNAYIRGVKDRQWPRYSKRLWQYRYWDSIIKDELGYEKIKRYIQKNPATWKVDSLS